MLKDILVFKNASIVFSIHLYNEISIFYNWHKVEKTDEKKSRIMWTLNLHKPRFGVFLLMWFFPGPKTVLKEENHEFTNIKRFY